MPWTLQLCQTDRMAIEDALETGVDVAISLKQVEQM